MTESQPVPGSSLEPGQRDEAEPLGHLYKMSPTAGVATTDYAAINTVAIITMVLGVASVLTLFNPWLLMIPLAGVICGVVAMRQIRNSNGTQVGGFLVWGGLLLSLGIGGSVAGYQGLDAVHARTSQRQIDQLMEQMGREIRDGDYDAAYSNCSDRFRARVGADLFAARLKELNSQPEWGQIVSISWNQQPMLFEVNPDSKVETATAMAFERMEKLVEPLREVMVFVKEGEQWKLNDIPRLFPIPRSPGSASGGQ
jgi:hypothetical protein